MLDVHLPGRSGLELQAALLAADNPVPIVFITAFDDAQAKAQALDCGAVEFLHKPLDTERLLEVIERALQAGLIHSVVSEDELESAALAKAEEIAAKNPG